MKWIEAIIEVLKEAGSPMHYKEITQKIHERKYRPDSGATPAMTVSNNLTTNPDLFRKVSPGVYELVETAVTDVIDWDSIDWDNFDWGDGDDVPEKVDDHNYKNASTFIKSTVPSQLERDLLELIVNFPLPLASCKVCFADILNDMEPVEFSPEEKSPPQLIDAALLRKKLDELNKNIAELEAKVNWDYKLRNSYGQLLNDMIAAASEIENLLADSGDKVKVCVPKLGEFFPESKESPSKPRVVIYYKNIKSLCAERWPLMAGVFVHEMFHAWNYVRAERNQRSVLAIDEPMVEFEALYFLKELKTFTESNSHSLRDEVSRVNRESERCGLKKQRSVSDVAAYGFGYYLFKNLRDDSVNWIEIYSGKSASIDDGAQLVDDVKAALIPIYPFMSEAEVMKLFKKIIFDSHALSVTTGKSVAAKPDLQVSLRDLVLACIETIGRKCFGMQEIYAFAPIFKVCVPQCMNLENALKRQLDELVRDGVLDALPHDCYIMK